MESHGYMEELRVCEAPSCDSSIEILDNNLAANVIEGKNVVKQTPPLVLLANERGSLCPSTPDSNKESGDSMSNFTSPLTLVSLPSCGFHSQSDQSEDSPSTPKESVFDPFAPGPNELMNAPRRIKYTEEYRASVARSLNFVSFMNIYGCAKQKRDSERDDDDVLVEAVYDSLLEAIISKQAQEILAEISPLDQDYSGFQTPASLPLFNGIADTCPGAPVKQRARKLRGIDYGLCRKLDF